jgi:hypothetical protein
VAIDCYWTTKNKDISQLEIGYETMSGLFKNGVSIPAGHQLERVLCKTSGYILFGQVRESDIAGL